MGITFSLVQLTPGGLYDGLGRAIDPASLNGLTNYFNNSDFSNGLSPWTVNNPNGDVVNGNGPLTNATFTDYALYLVNQNDYVTQALAPTVYSVIQPQDAAQGVTDTFWAVCFDAKADPSDTLPTIDVKAQSSASGFSGSVAVALTSSWKHYCAEASVQANNQPQDEVVASVTIMNTAQDSTGANVGVSLDNVSLQRIPAFNITSDPGTTTFTAATALQTLTEFQTVEDVAATTTLSSVQLVTASLPTVTAVDVKIKKVTRKPTVDQKTKTRTIYAGVKTKTVHDCVQTKLSFGKSCCPKASCVEETSFDRIKNRIVSAVTLDTTVFQSTFTTAAITFVTNAVTLTVPITNTVLATQTLTVLGNKDQSAVVVQQFKTTTLTITPAATVTRTVFSKATSTAVVYDCDEKTSKKVGCASNARGAKALASYGKQALKQANVRAQQAGNPNVELQCSGSSAVYQC